MTHAEGLNRNGKRIANDDRFLAELAETPPTLYFQFDGFGSETYRIIRGEPDILTEKIEGPRPVRFHRPSD